MTKVNKTHFLKSRIGLLITAILTFGISWLVFLRATDTGSLQQYAIIIALVFFGLNRIYRAIKG